MPLELNIPILPYSNTRFRSQASARRVFVRFVSSRLLKKGSECFDRLSTNGKCSIVSSSAPFAPSINSGRALRLSKGERWFFQQPARAFLSGLGKGFAASA